LAASLAKTPTAKTEHETQPFIAGCPIPRNSEPKLRGIKLLSHGLYTAMLCPVWSSSVESWGLNVTTLRLVLGRGRSNLRSGAQ